MRSRHSPRPIRNSRRLVIGPKLRLGHRSYAEEQFNSLNSFVFIDKSGTEHVVRWSLLPAASTGGDRA